MKETNSSTSGLDDTNGLRRKTPRQGRSRLTVESILQAAREIIEREGVRNLTTTRIAERAGISVGAFYEYYSNREAVLYDLHRQVSTGIGSFAEALARHDGAESPSESVRLAVSHLYGAHQTHRPLLLDIVGTVPELQGRLDAVIHDSHGGGEGGQWPRRLCFANVLVTGAIRKFLAGPPRELTPEAFIAELSAVVVDYLYGSPRT